MIRTTVVALVLAFAFACCGCQEQTVDKRKCRLMALENDKLKAELEQRETRITELQSKLDKCAAKYRDIEQRHRQETEPVVELLMDSFADKEAELNEQINQLEAEIERLKQQDE